MGANLPVSVATSESRGRQFWCILCPHVAACHTFCPEARLILKRVLDGRQIATRVYGERPMAIAKITGPGLTAIALSVALLWGCFLGEQRIVHRSRQENARVLYELRQLQRRRNVQPASVPVPRPPSLVRPTSG
jgi:hypothetical protein